MRAVRMNRDVYKENKKIDFGLLVANRTRFFPKEEWNFRKKEENG